MRIKALTHRTEAGKKFQELVAIMTRLRAPDGCPWDRKQTFDTLKTYLLEETYEVLDAIDRRDWLGLEEELGDLLLQPVFLAELASGENLFTIADSLDAINQKLVRRHPHVFGDASAETAEDVKQHWDEIKRQEKTRRRDSPASQSILDDVPRNLPALVESEKIGKKASVNGFDWPDMNGVLVKIAEEANELSHAAAQASSQEIEHEIGDLLFTIVNLARFLKVDPEQALRRTNARFRQRFAYIENQFLAAGRTLDSANLEEMDQLWEQAKEQESNA